MTSSSIPPKESDPNVLTYSLGDFTLLSGAVIPDAYIAYRTFGSSSNPTILYPTWYSGDITSGNEWLVSTAEHPRRGLDPEKYYIVLVALFGNGQSTSPSNHPLRQNLPPATVYDNVRAQHQLLTEGLGIHKLRMVTGWSMGAAQSYQWATQYPDMVETIAPFCGSARTSFHNQIFIDGFTAPLRADQSFANGAYTSQPIAGLKGVGHVYAGWGMSQTWYRQQIYTSHYGHKTLQEHLTKLWEGWTCSRDANDMLYLAWTWLHADVGAQPLYAGESKLDVPVKEGGRMGLRGQLDFDPIPEDDQAFERALRGIKAQSILMPCRHDVSRNFGACPFPSTKSLSREFKVTLLLLSPSLAHLSPDQLYFPPEDTQIEARIMGPKARMIVCESIWGHFAGKGDNEEDAAFFDGHIADLLESVEKEMGAEGDKGKM
ncbi:homoserine acetyltransferase [Microstroma glucosiphilum]|uniref:Homoserine acetyltransferase n=1 Tax=Pseudomicrostroma glucosiphilum TaxID=1684307 RepID=A0A316UJI1_9BASI|nr:homoserine acetyltransferase [Pseudomicrostroma glucosiphilum]PWN24113.1 homoserine acetyltransferase [Pseudomicrostroma glucosiphilum]